METENQSAETERAAIVTYLNEEADDCMAFLLRNPGSVEFAQLAVSRAAYYRQAADYIVSGTHHMLNRPRPTANEPARGPEAPTLTKVIDGLFDAYAARKEARDRLNNDFSPEADAEMKKLTDERTAAEQALIAAVLEFRRA